MLTIITATFNVIEAGRAAMLGRCVESVASLLIPHEHIICDGASTDGTLDLLFKLKQTYQNVNVVSEPDSGIYEAFNKGVRLASDGWIYFLGSDDFIFSPNVLAEVIAEAEERMVDWVISPVRHSDASQPFPSAKYFRNILVIKPYCHQGVLMKKRLIERLGSFDEKLRIVSDFKLCLKAHLQNVKHLLVLKEYAEFNVAGGLSHTSAFVHDEQVRVLADVLGIDFDEYEPIFKKDLVPMNVICRLLFHRNSIIRYGARHALKRRIASFLGMYDANRMVYKLVKRF